jgi:hypothetical protein
MTLVKTESGKWITLDAYFAAKYPEKEKSLTKIIENDRRNPKVKTAKR